MFLRITFYIGIFFNFLNFGNCLKISRSAKQSTAGSDIVMATGLLATHTNMQGLSSCLVQCNLNAICNSFFYNKMTGGCQIHNTVFTSLTGGVAEKGWRYYVAAADASQYNSSQIITSSGKKYKVVFNLFMWKTWYQARDICLAMEGKLAEPPTKAELLSLASKIPFYYVGAIWIGGTDEGSDGTYKWTSTGQVISYSNWFPLYIKLGPLFNCLHITAVFGVWGEGICSATSPYFICEFA